MENEIKIFFGIENKYIDVTYICYKKLVKDNILIIPKNDVERAKIFGDPIFGILKHIKINDKIYTENEEVNISLPETKENIDLSLTRKNWWNTEGKNIHSPEERLAKLHGFISLNHGNMRDEYPEQLLSMKFIKETDTVLEIGGNIGRNSCIIGTILNDDKRLVVLESFEAYANQLRENRDNNYFNFHIESSALSKVPLIQKGWNTYVSEIVPIDFTKVNTINFENLLSKYSLKFNVLVLDCEGAIYQILKDEPNLLDNIETIIIENDFTEIDKKEFVHNFFKEKGFKAVLSQGGGWGPCSSCFYQVYQKL